MTDIAQILHELSTVVSNLLESTMRLTSARLIFRDYIAEDFPFVRAIDADPQVTQMRGGTSIIETRYRERFEAILAAQTAIPRQHYDCVLLTPLTPQTIGHCHLHITNART